MEHLYWIVMLDSFVSAISGIAVVLFIFSLIFLVISLVCCAGEERITGTAKKQFKYGTLCTIAAFFFIIANAFIPSTKQMIAIITIPKIVNNEQIQEMPDNALKLINSKLKEWAEETEIIPEEKKK